MSEKKEMVKEREKGGHGMKKKTGSDWCLPRLWAQAFHTEGTKHDIFGEKTERNPRLSALSATSAERKPRHRGIMGNQLPDLYH